MKIRGEKKTSNQNYWKKETKNVILTCPRSLFSSIQNTIFVPRGQFKKILSQPGVKPRIF